MEFSNLCDARAAGNAGHTVPRKYRFSFNPLVPPFFFNSFPFLFFILFWCVFYPGDMFHWKWLEKLFCRFHRFRLDLKCEWNSKEDEEKMISGKCVVQGRYNLTSSHFFSFLSICRHHCIWAAQGNISYMLHPTGAWLTYEKSSWLLTGISALFLSSPRAAASVRNERTRTRRTWKKERDISSR